MQDHIFSKNIYYRVIWKPNFFRCPFYEGADKKQALQNKAELAKSIWIPNTQLVFANQRHSDDIFLVTSENYKEDIEADAMITSEMWIALGTLTSDCLPILFSDEELWVVWVIHAGWKWLQKNIIIKTFKKLLEIYGSNIQDVKVFIWPAISQKNYEVGEEFSKIFEAKYLLSTKWDKYLFDTKSLARDQCLESWISQENIEISDICTYEDKENFHSYRRKTHTGEKGYGNNACVIWRK